MTNVNRKSTPAISQVILKVASRCNLNCSYCYVYNKADTSWRSRPARMSDDVFEAALARVQHHCRDTGQSEIRLTFHGGEPCLIGHRKFGDWCIRIRESLADIVSVHLSIQTNGTLIDKGWIDTFARHGVDVSVSMDGPKELHDVNRVDHMGRGSYDRVEQGFRLLKDAGVPFGIMAVIPFGEDPLEIHRHFVELGSTTITYILPNFTHETVGPIWERYGPTPCADFLVPLFDEWWFNDTMDVRVRDLWNIVRMILGGSSTIETFGNRPPGYVFVETDGDMEGLDNLYVCEDGLTQIGLNVYDADFRQILDSDTLHRTAIFNGLPLPQACHKCVERDTCAGGYLPHRYSRTRAFDNPSVWCADFLKLFAHIRERLGVTPDETRRRRVALERIAADAARRDL